MGTPTLTRWPSTAVPSRESLEHLFRAENLSAGWWSNGPDYRYNAHSHRYHKVLYCARGSIRFVVHPAGETYELSPETAWISRPAASTQRSSDPRV